MTEDEKNSRRLTFLVADLGHLKTEIGRRSALQERVLALYFVAVAFASHSLTPAQGEGLSLLVPSIWVAAALVAAFWKREHLEIARLGGVIREGVARPAAVILGCLPGDLVPSELRGDDPATDPRTRALDRRFLWLSLVAIPSGVTIVVFLRRCDSLSELSKWYQPHPWLAFISMGAAVSVIRMLASLNRGRDATGA